MKSFSLSLIIVLCLAIFGPVSGQSKTDQKVAKMKADVEKIGVGSSARINVRLANGSYLSGYVKRINEKTFVLVNDASGSETEIEYADAEKVDKIPRRGSRLSTFGKAMIGFGAVIGGLLLICAISNRCQE